MIISYFFFNHIHRFWISVVIFWIWFIEPKGEHICFFAVSLPFGVFSIFLFWEWYAWYESEEEGDEDWGEDHNEAELDVHGNEEDAPPHDGFTEVIWVAGVSPKTWLDELACAWFWSRQVVSELAIGHNFDDETEKPDCGSDIVKDSQVRLLSWRPNIYV